MHNFTFVRHSDYIPDSFQIMDRMHGLTDLGIAEACQIGNFLNLTESEHPVIVHLPDDKRFTSTAALLVEPLLAIKHIPEYVTQAVQLGKFVLDNALDYVPPTDEHNFNTRMLDSYYKRTNLRFLYDVSREMNEASIKLSTTKTMSEIIANKVASIVSSNQKEGLDDTGNIVVSREFFFPSFRVELTKSLQGRIAAEEYIDRYSRETEGVDLARLSLAFLNVERSRHGYEFAVFDDFGEFHFELQQLGGTAVGALLERLNVC